MADELHLSGWYHSGITIGLDDKPIRTGATLHLLAVKLYARTYGGASDGNIQGWHEHTQNEAKFVNLFDMMLSNFFGKGHHVTCDLAYTGDNMAQVSQKIWKINMVGTIQAN